MCFVVKRQTYHAKRYRDRGINGRKRASAIEREERKRASSVIERGERKRTSSVIERGERGHSQ